ncbi:hypothetical protein, partial [Rhizobium johnstonii]|uniref:hypothetical protein n=1 Tax=Rhizobium johnstonii TaxID=3019933 RepID=UPI003F99367C
QRVVFVVLDPVIEEMMCSFAKDPAAQSLAADEIESLVALLGTSFSLDDFASHLWLIEQLKQKPLKRSLVLFSNQLFD